jgi:PIN domain nuclease of toxin-antitoxin system
VPGALLDTHALYWLVSGTDDLTDAALIAIGEQQDAGTLFVSPITAWELAVAAQKPPGPGRPDLGGQLAREWFKEAVELTGARLISVHQRIAFEAANVATVYGRKDPGDCFLIATARVRRIPIITRDAAMIDLAQARPDYLSVIQC